MSGLSDGQKRLFMQLALPMVAAILLLNFILLPLLPSVFTRVPGQTDLMSFLFIWGGFFLLFKIEANRREIPLITDLYA